MLNIHATKRLNTMFYKIEREELELKIKKMKIQAEKSKSIFLSNNYISIDQYNKVNSGAKFWQQFSDFSNVYEALKSGNGNKMQNLLKSKPLKNILHDLILFKDDEITKKLIELGLNENSLQWFVSIEDIMKELDALGNDKEIFISYQLITLWINAHLDFSFFNSLHTLTNSSIEYNNSASNIYHLGFIKFMRTKKSSKIKIIKRLTEFFGKLGKDNIEYKLLLNIFKGNTSILKKDALEHILLNSICSNRKTCLKLFDLTKLVYPNKKLKSEEEFYSIKLDPSTSKYLDENYNSDYNFYKISKVTTLLFDKKTSF
jgi:hypothetical protein